MKRFAIAILMLLTAGLCLAQSDSPAPAADTTKTKVQIEQTTDDSTTVTVTTEKGQTDSTTTVVIRRERSGRERDQRMRRRRDWVLGCRMYSLDPRQFPGTVFLQRRVSRVGFFGLGANYINDPIGPTTSYARNDSSYSHQTGRHWSVTITPEYILTRSIGAWVGSISVRCNYQYEKYWQSSDGTDTYTYSNSSGSYHSSLINKRYGVELPVAIERRFRIGTMVFSAGFASQFISFFGANNSSELTMSSTSTSGGTSTYRQHSCTKEPLHFAINSPFNGAASIQLKYWF